MSLFDDPDVGRVPEPTYSVTELSDAIGNALRATFRDELWVRGEIRDLSRPVSGHVYFTLTDAEGNGGGACVSVMLPSRAKPSVNAILTEAGGGVRMSDGTEVRIRGRLDWYGPRGQLQLRMSTIDPAYTLGQLEVARAELLRRLGEEGLLHANAGRALPAAPLRIGLVTSVGSAAEADFVDELRRSGFAFTILVADARVQGLDAPRSIASAIRRVATHRPEAIAVVRGGGARTDLAAFDDEAVARAIATCTVPVLTGIGHETDVSVADEVAHTAAKTPTACAQLLVARAAAVTADLEASWSRIARHALQRLGHHDAVHRSHAVHVSRSARRALDRNHTRLSTLAERARRAAHGTVEVAARRLENQRGRVTGAARSHVRASDLQLDAAARRLRHRAPRALADGEHQLAGLEARVRALDPERTLARGWSITTRADGTVVRSPADVTPGDALLTTLAGGQVRSIVSEAADGAAPTVDRDA